MNKEELIQTIQDELQNNHFDIEKISETVSELLKDYADTLGQLAELGIFVSPLNLESLGVTANGISRCSASIDVKYRHKGYNIKETIKCQPLTIRAEHLE